jgi:hypothetical protein
VSKEKEGRTEPSKDVPLHGVEKKGDRACRHDFCTGSDCRLDTVGTVLTNVVGRLDKITTRRREKGTV